MTQMHATMSIMTDAITMLHRALQAAHLKVRERARVDLAEVQRLCQALPFARPAMLLDHCAALLTSFLLAPVLLPGQALLQVHVLLRLGPRHIRHGHGWIVTIFLVRFKARPTCAGCPGWIVIVTWIHHPNT